MLNSNKSSFKQLTQNLPEVESKMQSLSKKVVPRRSSPPLPTVTTAITTDNTKETKPPPQQQQVRRERNQNSESSSSKSVKAYPQQGSKNQQRTGQSQHINSKESSKENSAEPELTGNCLNLFEMKLIFFSLPCFIIS